MEKMKMETPNLADENFKKLAALFPNAVTETITGYDEDGNAIIERAIDADVLKQEISSEVVEGKEERYQFTWPDKKKAIMLANEPTTLTLRLDEEKSVGRDGTPGKIDSENMYIEGDNLDALKILRETYLGKIKMIYIDPPYNTGNDFIYDDDYSSESSEYIVGSGQLDESGNRMFQNLESNGRYHTDWINMIYPRLKVAKDLLSEDGVIFISLDEKEIGNLRKICDEIFGERNLVSNFIWQSRTSISNDYEVSLNHNHTLVYSKNREKLVFGGDKIDESEYINPDNDPRGPWKLVPLDANHAGGNTVYPVKNPKTGVDYYPPNGRIWCYNEDTMHELMDDGRIKFGLNDDSSPKRKLYLNERKEKGDKKTPSSVVIDAGTTKDGTKEIMDLFDGEKVFDYPKPVSFIRKMIEYGAPKGGVVMDFFSGSGTAAQAVLQYNEEHEEKLQFILVQLPENLDESYEKASSTGKKTIKNAIDFLDKTNRPHRLTEIARERVLRSIEQIKKDESTSDYGFRLFKVDSSNMEDVYYTPSKVQQQTLATMENNIKPDRTAMDLLIQVMLDLGIKLSSPIEESEIAGKKIYMVDGKFLIACFDDDITDDVVTEMAKMEPVYAVLRDSGMMDDSVATNFDQIFETYSPNTERRVL